MEMETDSATIVVARDRPAPSVGNQASDTPFSCNICKKSYTRIDHLARHHRSHSRERPFVCDICKKSFARVDLLKRHTATHDSDHDQIHAPPSTNKRRKTRSDPLRPRAQRACKACAEAKSRCEGNQPCLRCQQRCITCEYPPSRTYETPQRSTPSQDGPSRGQTVPSTPSPEPHEEDSLQTHDSVNASMAHNHRNDDSDLLDLPLEPHNTLQLPTPSVFETGAPSANRYDDSGLALSYAAALPNPSAFGQGNNPNFGQIHSLDFLPLATAHLPTSFDELLNDESFARDDLNFGIDFASNSPLNIYGSLQLPPVAPITTAAELSASRTNLAAPGLRSSLDVSASAQAFRDSIWLWTPDEEDHGTTEQRNLSLPWNSTSADQIPSSDSLPPHQRINKVSRGAVLAMVLRTCESALYSHVVSNFPSPELLTQLIQNSVNFQTRIDCPWIHLPTIKVSKERPEFLLCLVTHGAALSPKPDIRKLGFAMYEALRTSQFKAFERDNRLTRDLRALQSFALELEVGLWSGNRRKMEIAESFAMPLITMVRRAGHFRGSRMIEISPQEQDSGENLESEWLIWVQNESFKRLALHLFYRDTRSSMSLLSQPLISYAELTTSAPCRRDLWEASTALQWKAIYLQYLRDEDKTNQMRRAWLDDSTYIFQNSRMLDVDLSLLLATASMWPQIWQYREMITAARNSRSRDDRHGSLVLSSKRQDLLQMLEFISMNAKEWHVQFKPALWLLHEQCSMHLYVSLDDAQLLAGKEGEEESRRIFPIMSTWAKSPDARQALFHAGQILRAAKEHEKFMLRDASAVAVYHASLVFWTYAVASRGDNGILSDNSPSTSASHPGGSHVSDLIRLDDVESSEVRRFLVLGRGIPCIRSQMHTEDGLIVQDIPLSEPTEVMKTMARILQNKYEGGERSNPPLIDNLSKLMHSLGRACLPGAFR